jgi:hypothetical protein
MSGYKESLKEPIKVRPSYPLDFVGGIDCKIIAMSDGVTILALDFAILT